MSADDHPGVRVPPPLIYLAFFVTGMLADRLLPLRFVRGSLLETAGWLLMTASGVIALSSIWMFRRHRTTILPMRAASSLVVEGPYRFSRNPMYVSMALLYLGLACWYGSWWTLLLFPAMIAVIARFVIAREEAYLGRRFGRAYEQYRKRVRRWL